MLNAESPHRSRIQLPPVPEEFASDAVAAWQEPVEIDTYLPAAPDSYPAFLDSRVYQGSSGRVYPLPFHERIDPELRPHRWQAVHLENEWLRLMILPELGGRIHIAYDKAADYDIFYRNNVIKPALVGLAGPWISGGVEFNWPQHHRPGTFLPTDVSIEHEPDGSVTVWCSDHDPFARMKGMHGIRLRPGSSVIEARVRLYNRSEVTQTFLWWANVAAAVNNDYQSFFPTDVTHVADHAKRAITTFPRVTGSYYGVDYPGRVDSGHPDADRLDWYRNIPVPTSYMVMSTDHEFFGGYDHGRQAGFVHWASKDISPGKKQWTWGNAEFGWAWDANLTDDDGPYVELMAGVFTDNQPDFSYLAPGETKTFSQYWYPIEQIGPAQQANRNGALSVTRSTGSGSNAGPIRVGVAVTRVRKSVTVHVQDAAGQTLHESTGRAAPGEPLLLSVHAPEIDPSSLTVVVTAEGEQLVAIWPRSAEPSGEAQTPATEPPAPAQIGTVDELFFVGQYLEQYRHATRSPEPYWVEGLRREPGDVRTNVALAARRYAAGDFEGSAQHLETALARQSTWVPNPADGEVHYRMGLALERLGRNSEAERHFAKASWSAAWSVPAHYALARLLARAGVFESALERLTDAVALDPQHLQSADLLVRVLRELGRGADAEAVLTETLLRDPLDQWARDLAGLALTHDAPTLLDIALEYSGSGFTDDALRLLELAADRAGETALGQVNVAPLVEYHRASILAARGDTEAASNARRRARIVDALFCFPSRLDDVRVLHDALDAGPDARAALLLGHWYYDKGRRDDAIALWEEALDAEPDPFTAVTAHRNLGIAAYNVLRDKHLAREHYDEVLRLAPADAKLLQERDQLGARLGETSSDRLARLAAGPWIVAQRDDLTVSLATLLTSEGRADEALRLLSDRQFQPWEGGEGEVIAAWDRATLTLTRHALERNESEQAVELIRGALTLPSNLGEGRHPLANTAELHLAAGDVFDAVGDRDAAREAWQTAADSRGDFASMAPQHFSRQTVFSILALGRLGRGVEAETLTDRLGEHIETLSRTPATIDYFATSLPTMLLFTDSPQKARDHEVAELRRQLEDLALARVTRSAQSPTGL